MMHDRLVALAFVVAVFGTWSCAKHSGKTPPTVQSCEASARATVQWVEIFRRNKGKVCTGVMLDSRHFVSSALCFGTPDVLWSDYSVKIGSRQLNLDASSRLLPHTVWYTEDKTPSFVTSGLPLAIGALAECIPDVASPFNAATNEEMSLITVTDGSVKQTPILPRTSAGFLVDEEMHVGKLADSKFACPWQNLAGLFQGGRLLAIPFLPFSYDRPCEASDGYRFIRIDPKKLQE